MAVTMSKLFAGSQAPSNEVAKEPLVPAQFWLNIGYTIEVEDPKTGDLVEQFVALPGGIPLDTPSRLETKKGQKSFLALNLARNALQAQLLEECKDFSPGEDRYMDVVGGLKLQIHRVKEATATVEDQDNPYMKKVVKLFG